LTRQNNAFGDGFDETIQRPDERLDAECFPWRFLICSSLLVSFFTFLNVTTGEETVVVLIPTLCKEKLLCLGQSSQLAQKARIEIILHFTEYHATTGGIYSNKN
jgi:hypothetical protein